MRMKNTYFQIKDKCRKGLLPYLEKAFSNIQVKENPEILDIGCGTGVPTLWIVENYGGRVSADDIDREALDWLENKIFNNNLGTRITTLNKSFFDLEFMSDSFDIILSEGLLNVVGFEQGFQKVIGMLKNNGYFIIHDEYKDHEKKCDFIRKYRCKLVETIYLDEKIWWNDYYKELELEINASGNPQVRDLFQSELKEINCYKSNPSSFKSIYYVVKKP